MHTPSYKLREAWLDAALPLVGAHGWTLQTLDHAAENAGLSKQEQALAAPRGVNDLIDHMMQRASDRAVELLATRDLSSLRTHEKVAEGIVAWLEALEPEKAAVRRAIGRAVTPIAAGSASAQIWGISDTIWQVAGDRSEDYNHYTKRALLSAVIPGIVLYWLDEPTPEQLRKRIDRRLQQAMKLGRTGGQIIGPVLDRLGPKQTSPSKS